jgi:3',5'-cyclic AMP phosphodiesterase CpdA
VVDLNGVAAPLVKARKHFADGERRLAALLSGNGKPKAVSFAVITGDLTDAFTYSGASQTAVTGQVEAFRRATSKSPIPLFLALGNHDVQHYGLAADGVKPEADHSVAGAARAAWIRSAGCFRNGTYYEFTRNAGATRYAFLVLDNGYSAAGASARPAITIAPEQLHWLRTRAAANRDAVIVLAMHIPLGKDATSEAIRSAVSDAPNIAFILAGHNHRDQIEELALGASSAVQVRTAALGYGEQNWRRVRLLPDRIEVCGTGKPDTVEHTIMVAGKALRPAA